MPIKTLTTRDLLDQTLQILHVANESQRERMLDEIQQFIQVKSILISLKALPDADQKRFQQLSPNEIEPLLRQHIGEGVVQKALAQAAEEIIPLYIAELAQTATEAQKQRIEKLLQTIGPQ